MYTFQQVFSKYIPTLFYRAVKHNIPKNICITSNEYLHERESCINLKKNIVHACLAPYTKKTCYNSQNDSLESNVLPNFANSLQWCCWEEGNMTIKRQGQTLAFRTLNKKYPLLPSNPTTKLGSVDKMQRPKFSQ